VYNRECDPVCQGKSLERIIRLRHGLPVRSRYSDRPMGSFSCLADRTAIFAQKDSGPLSCFADSASSCTCEISSKSETENPNSPRKERPLALRKQIAIGQSKPRIVSRYPSTHGSLPPVGRISIPLVTPWHSLAPELHCIIVRIVTFFTAFGYFNSEMCPNRPAGYPGRGRRNQTLARRKLKAWLSP
jgi:hypothetical protein